MLYCEGMRKTQEELGISCITSFLRAHGHCVTLIAMEDGMVSMDQIMAVKPDIIGCPMYQINKSAIYQLLHQVKKRLPKVITVVGGILPTYHGEQILSECQDIDYAMAGEGELVWLKIAEAGNDTNRINQIDSMIYRSNGNIITNQRHQLVEDLEKLPFPARDILIQNQLKMAQISTSRGCLSACSFCASQLLWKRWRGRSAQSIVDEIELLHNEYGIRFFNFIDGSFEDHKKDSNRIYDIASEIIRRDLNIFYYVQMRAEFYKRATPKLMELLRRSGLSSVCVGIEAGNAEDLKLYHKIATVEDMNQMIQLLRNYEINIEPGFINFNSYSTLDSLEKNIDFLEKNKFACNISYITTPCNLYEGTALYEKVQRERQKREVYSYKEFVFFHKDTQILCEYVNEVMNSNSEISAMCKAAGFYSTRWLTVISCYKRMFYEEKHRKAYAIVVEYEKEHMKICEQLNKAASQWFRELIYLARDSWDNEIADQITDNYVSNDFIKQIITAYDKKRLQFNKKLIMLDRGYADQLLDFLAGS